MLYFHFQSFQNIFYFACYFLWLMSCLLNDVFKINIRWFFTFLFKLLICNVIPLWSGHILCTSSLPFFNVMTCFIACMWSILENDAWKECGFCCCWVEITTLLLIFLFISIYGLWFFYSTIYWEKTVKAYYYHWITYFCVQFCSFFVSYILCLFCLVTYILVINRHFPCIDSFYHYEIHCFSNNTFCLKIYCFALI